MAVSATPEQLEKAAVDLDPEKDPQATATATADDGDGDAPELVVEDLLVEDVSIDGMCGVY